MNYYCVVPENIQPPPPRGVEIQRGGDPKGDNFREGVGWPLKPFFWGLPVKLITKLSVIFLVISICKQKLLISSMIVYFQSAKCFCYGLHNSLYNTIAFGP